MNHFIEVCKKCGDAISQCRCFDCSKEKREGICDKCSKDAGINSINSECCSCYNRAYGCKKQYNKNCKYYVSGINWGNN
jgi:hypothetical protein